MKEKIAQMIIDRMNDDQKRDMIQKFYDRNKDNPQIDEMVQSMKSKLGYDGKDVPKRD